MMLVRGVRGATTVAENDAEMIVAAAAELMQAIIAANEIEEAHVASVFFTSTPDLTAAYPAKGARIAGWQQTALMGMQEIDNPNGLPRCIRVLIHWNTEKTPDELVHVYLHGTESLRPDFAAHKQVRVE
jgi:chorismate mutase